MHLKIASERGTSKTFCPSEVARALFPEEWRDKMDLIREVADNLVSSKTLEVLQQGKIIDDLPTKAYGPIRLRKGKGLQRANYF